MSRSKRAPIATEGYGNPSKKRRKRDAAKKVRSQKGEIASGGAFKKESSSWDICDWKFRDAGPKAGRK